MEIKVIIFVFLLSLGLYPAFAQSHKLDTMYFTDLKSKDIILFTTIKELYENLGEPRYIHKNLKTLYFKREGKKRVMDTALYFNIYDYYNKYGLSYVEKDGKVRLNSIDYKVCDTITILHPKILLSRNLTISEFKEKFPLSAEDAPTEITVNFLPYEPQKESEKAFLFILYSGSIHNTQIEFYFDESKKLRYMYFERDDW